MYCSLHENEQFFLFCVARVSMYLLKKFYTHIIYIYMTLCIFFRYFLNFGMRFFFKIVTKRVTCPLCGLLCPSASLQIVLKAEVVICRGAISWLVWREDLASLHANNRSFKGNFSFQIFFQLPSRVATFRTYVLL